MLKLENLTKQFGDKIAVDQLDMTVKPGEIMGLIGQNGAGKTTTFRMILDFIRLRGRARPLLRRLSKK